MPFKDVIKPKQQRSQETQRKLLTALHKGLKVKFFEHISIKELADHAGVSVGTFYRRFKDKNSLLPLLYQDFGNDLSLWVEQLEEAEYSNLQEAVETMSTKTYHFLADRSGVFRTLHLNSRLHSTLLDSDKTVDRKDIYRRLSNILLKFQSEITVQDQEKAVGIVIYMMINGLLDKVIYPTLTPAIASDLSAQELSIELPKMLLAYLTR